MATADDPRLVSSDAAVVDVDDAVSGLGLREVIRATGADRIAFLHRLLTGNVQAAPPGAGVRTLLLNLKGHVVSDMFAFVRPEEVRLVVAAGQAQPTALALNKYAIMDDFTAAPDPALRLCAVYGARTFERLAAAGVGVPAAVASGGAWSHGDAPFSGGSLWVIKAPGLGADGAWLFGDKAAIDAVAAALARAGVPALSPQTAQALRIIHGEPAFGSEISEDHFPMEIGLTGAIDYSKGCYLGQEPIVRVRDRGHINWRLVALQVQADVTPAPGDTLESDIKPRAGRITSASRLPGEAPVAMALLHVSVPVGTTVRVKHGDQTFAATVVPFARAAT